METLQLQWNYQSADGGSRRSGRSSRRTGDGKDTVGTYAISDAAKVVFSADAYAVVLVGQLAAVYVVVVEGSNRSRYSRVILQTAVIRCPMSFIIQ